MLSWLGKKALNFRLASQIKLTQEQLLSYTPIERGYVLLFIACLRKGWKKDLPELVLAMECPPVFSEKQLLDLFYSLEDLRNLTFAKIKDAKRLNGDIIPAAILKHFEYSLHSINVGLATLAAGIRDSNTQPCADSDSGGLTELRAT